jgi:hypothetical protein
MTPPDLHHLLEFCGEALKHPSAERKAFLDEAYAGDASLRQTTKALLFEHPATNGFLKEPAWVPERPRLANGTRLGPRPR